MTDGDRRSTPDFQAELTGAAEHLGIPVLAVEKDYWVTQALRGMAAAYPDGFIFKGGTSIMKGWRIGHRFSEDIDILVVERPEPDSVNGRDKILKAICDAGASACGAEAERVLGGKGEHRAVLAAAYAEGIEALYYGPPDALPSWQVIEERVHSTAELL